MLKRVIGKNVEEVSEQELLDMAAGFARVVLDLGTGDGKFAYSYAQAHPDTFVIAVDADKQQMEKVSHKAARKPAKGGLPGVLFIWSAVEALSAQLAAVADHIYINFPWGALLAGTIKAQSDFTQQFARLLKPGGELEILASYDADYEPQTIAKYELPQLDSDYIEGEFAKSYQSAGLKLEEWYYLDDAHKNLLHGSWPKKLLDSRAQREVCFIKLVKE